MGNGDGALHVYGLGIGEVRHIPAHNISDMTNKSKDKFAYTLLDLENAVDDSVIDKLSSIDGVCRGTPGKWGRCGRLSPPHDGFGQAPCPPIRSLKSGGIAL